MNKQPDTLGFLIGDVQRLMRRQFQQQLEGSCLTLAQARALVHIARSEGIQADLAERLDIQPITLARQSISWRRAAWWSGAATPMTGGPISSI
jgi:hypothetical protein